MMFAGGGLFLSMVATTVLISGDVSRMREEERAKQAEKCAIAAQAQTSQTQAPAGTAPNDDFTTQPAPQPADDACATTGSGTPAVDGATVDPATGQPLAQGGDGFTTSPNVDPATGQVDQPGAANFDAATGQPIDPTIDPVTGQPLPGASDPAISSTADPLAGQGASGAPGGNVVEAGF